MKQRNWKYSEKEIYCDVFHNFYVINIFDRRCLKRKLHAHIVNTIKAIIDKQHPMYSLDLQKLVRHNVYVTNIKSIKEDSIIWIKKSLPLRH